MPLPEISPYDVLGVPPTAGADEIMAGYRRALAARTHDRRQVSQAFNELRNARKRAEHDLPTQHEPAGAGLDAVFAGLPATSFLSTDAGPNPPLAALVDLTADGVVPARRDPPAPPHQFASSPRFGPTEDDLPPIEFPL